MITLLDSYSESNQDSNYFLGQDFIGPNKVISAAQSFTCPSTIPLYSAKFYLKKTGLPTGNAVAKLYNITGTSGVNATPTGAAIATSDNLDVSTLTGSKALVQLLFTGANAIALSASTNYAIAFEYSNGDASNYVEVGTDTSSPTHAGNNSFFYTIAWADDASTDTIFYVYGGKPTVEGFLLFE